MTEKELISHLIEKCEGMKLNQSHCEGVLEHCVPCKAYNQALSDLISYLKTLSNE